MQPGHMDTGSLAVMVGGTVNTEPAGKHEVRDLNVKLVVGDKFSLT